MYRNIMVPVDGSSFCRDAVLQALRIALQSGATLRLVRVASDSILTGGPDGVLAQGRSQQQIRSLELGELYSLAAECRAHSTANVTASLLDGPVVDALMGYANRQRVDLIVMRTRGRKGLARAWFGSVTDSLIRQSGIPVLVVRSPSLSTALESGFAFKRILVPLDGSALAEQSLDSAVGLARVDGARLTLLRVVATSKSGDTSGLQSAIGPAQTADVTEAQAYLNSLLTAPLDRAIEINRRVVVADDISSAILRAARSDEVDLIAIATRGRGAIARATSGSVADRIMREAPVSAMVTHPMGSATLRIDRKKADGAVVPEACSLAP